MKCPHCLITIDSTRAYAYENHLAECLSLNQQSEAAKAQLNYQSPIGMRVNREVSEAAKQAASPLVAANPFYLPNGDIKPPDTLADKIKQLQAQLTAAKQKIIELETTLKVLENK